MRKGASQATGLSSPTEPCSTVSALTGFDPSRDHVITADASKVSGADFLRALQGKPPLTEVERAEREIEKRRKLAELEQQHKAEMLAVRGRILAAFPTPESAARCLAKWEAEGADVTGLTETRSDPMKARAA